MTAPPESSTNGAASPGGRVRIRRRANRHGDKRRRRMLASVPIGLLDKRSAVSVAARKRREELATQLGGDVTPAQAMLIDAAVKTELIVRAAEDWILRQESLIIAPGELVPVVMQRQALVDSLARLLKDLGLRRTAKPVPDLGSYLAAKATPPAPGAAAATPSAEGEAPVTSTTTTTTT